MLTDDILNEVEEKLNYGEEITVVFDDMARARKFAHLIGYHSRLSIDVIPARGER